MSADFNDAYNSVFLRGSCANHIWEWPEDTRATVSPDKITLSAHMADFDRVTHIISFIDGDRSYFVSLFAEIETILALHAPKNEPLWRTLVGIRNTDHELILKYPRNFEVLMVRVEEQDGEAQKLFQDAILPIVRGREFFITDKGFAGVATPMIGNGDTIAIITGMGRAAILRDTDPKKIGLERRVDAGGNIYQRITGFAYVGCHHIDEFENLVKENTSDHRKHICVNRDLKESYII
ncbi:hypothetical protein EYC80_002066 [Monilinia laxa]|nr:hypothetical protein EYC80_002066 [Monilinia laxa]